MTFVVEIAEEPGLRDLLAAEQPPPETELTAALAQYVATPGVERTPAHDALDQDLRDFAQGTTEGVGLLERLRRFFAGEQHEVVETEDKAFELTSYWLTVPEGVASAAGTVSVSVESGRETSASIKVLGSGGGPTFDLTIKEGLSLEAPTSRRIGLEVVGRFEKVRVTRDGRVVATYPRLAKVNLDNRAWMFNPTAPPPASTCGAELSSESFDAPGSGGTVTKTLSVTRGTTVELSVGLKLEKIGLDATIGSKVSYERDVEFSYTLPEGHRYLATRYALFPAYLWTVNAA